MKFLILLLAILAGVWIWRSGRDKRLADRTPPPVDPSTKNTGTQPMVACRHCGVHLPGADAIAGRLGSYCSTAHRQQAEG